MGGWDDNPYSNAGNDEGNTYPLRIVAEISAEANHDFNMIVVWRDRESGRLFYAQDAGCSCPAPFENYDFTNAANTSLTELPPSGFAAFEKEVRDWRDDIDSGAPGHEAVATFLRTVEEALKSAGAV